MFKNVVMNMAGLIIIPILFVFCFTGCDDNNHEDDYYWDPQSDNVILPLHMGNAWTFYSRMEISTGEVIEGTYTMQIIDRAEIQGDIVYDFHENGTNTGEYYLNFEEGCYRYGYYQDFQTHIYEPPILAYRYPGYPERFYDEFGIRIVSTDHIIRTVAGTFHCYMYEHQPTQQGEFFYEYFAPDYGPVSFEMLLREFNGTHEIQYYIIEHLIGYDLYSDNMFSAMKTTDPQIYSALSPEELLQIEKIKIQGKLKFASQRKGNHFSDIFISQ